MDKIKRIKELTAELLQYCHEYYDLDNPTISDAAYDKKYNELEQLENEVNFWLVNSPTRKIQGTVLDCFIKVEHSKPMLSAAKTKDINEIKEFLGGNEFYCSYKLDGLTLVVRYKNGKFVQAVTRGTGIIGEDVTEQAKMISNLPMNIPYNEYLELRGECVVSWDTFNIINEELENKYSHPRNLAAGSLRNLNTDITKKRSLSYVVFECVSDLYDEDGIFDSKWDELCYLDHLGFETVEKCHEEAGLCVEEMRPEKYKYPVDGLIFELNNKLYSKSIESTSHHEGCRMALKWADEVYETTLLDVEWNPTRTGLIAPTAVFSPVDLDGAITTRATLHNLSIIQQLELGIGDTITVYRSNMVIPKIDDNLTRSNTLVIPDKCPCCDTETIIRYTDNSKVLVCPNPDCSAKKIAQFTHFVSRNAMNIDGLSEKTLEALISHGFIRNFRDIFHLTDCENELICLDGFGKKSVKKLLKSIEESKHVSLANFICALGIPTIGSSASKTIAEYCEYDIATFLKLLWNSRWNDGFKWTKLNDFGEVAAKNLDEYFDKNVKMLRELADEMNFVIPEKKVVDNNPFTGKTLCVTGKLNYFTRDSINEKITSLGAKAAGSVSKKTDYLITNESSGSSKYKKAIELGVPIITEEEFISMAK